MDYRERVKAMSPQKRESTLRNYDALVQSGRWLVLPEHVREELEEMAQILREENTVIANG